MGDSYGRLESPWQGLGRCHLAGFRLGGAGRGLVITQGVLAAAQGRDHAVPELEGKGHESGSGSTEGVWSKLCWLARFASNPSPASGPHRLHSPLKSGSPGGNRVSTHGPTPEPPGTKSKGALLLMTFHDALWVPKAICELSYFALELRRFPSLGTKTLWGQRGEVICLRVTQLENKS